MRTQTLIVLLLALAFGGIAAVGVVMFTGGEPKAADMATIVVAVAEVPRGSMITAEAVTARQYPRDLVPAGVVSRVEDAVGRAALSPIVRDEPLIEGKLAPKGAGRGLASLIKKGMRAITVQTPNVATGVAGFIVPGNRVDVLMTFNETGASTAASAAAITLLEDVEILAVDQNVDAPAENKVDAAQMRSVTLSVTPDQATKLTLGQNRGTIHLSLRNSTDETHKASRPASMDDLSGGASWDQRLKGVITELNRNQASRRMAGPAPPPPPAPSGPPPRVIRTFKGTREGSARIDHGASPALR